MEDKKTNKTGEGKTAAVLPVKQVIHGFDIRPAVAVAVGSCDPAECQCAVRHMGCTQSQIPSRVQRSLVWWLGISAIQHGGTQMKRCIQLVTHNRRISSLVLSN